MFITFRDIQDKLFPTFLIKINVVKVELNASKSLARFDFGIALYHNRNKSAENDSQFGIWKHSLSK